MGDAARPSVELRAFLFRYSKPNQGSLGHNTITFSHSLSVHLARVVHVAPALRQHLLG